jgi:hypothetical protein
MSVEPVPPAKITALREALTRVGHVEFKNGSQISMWSKDGAIQVIRPGAASYTFAPGEFEFAYRRALEPPVNNKEQPSGDPAKYGEEAPW